MTRRVDYHELFDCDVKEAAAWLAARGSEYGAALSVAVEQQIHLILANPLAYAELRPGLRRAVIRRFGYILIYRLRGDDIRFVGFVHGSRDLDAWLGGRVAGDLA